MGTEERTQEEILNAHQGLVNPPAEETNTEAAPETQEVTNTATEEVTPNPAWDELLALLPEDMQALVQPKLKEWDQGVQTKIKDLHTQYEPYKDIAKNQVPVEDIEQAMALVAALQQDPEQVVKDAIEAFGLDFVAKELAATQTTEPSTTTEPDPFAEAGLDISKHPEFVQMKEALEQITGKVEQEFTAKEEAAAIEQHEKYLDELAEEHGEFDKQYVTTLMVNGLDGVKAVKQYQDIVNQAAAKLAGESKAVNTPPVVMGGDGNTGSGIPDNAVNLGKLTRTDANNLALDMIAKMRQEES